MAIKQVKLGGVSYDLDNRSITLTSTSGTLTTDQLAILQASDQNYIISGVGKFVLTTKDSTKLYYSREDAPSLASSGWEITIATRAYTLVSNGTIATQTYVDNAIGAAIAASY